MMLLENMEEILLQKTKTLQSLRKNLVPLEKLCLKVIPDHMDYFLRHKTNLITTKMGTTSIL
jgi:hypothetical protein